MSKGKGIGKGNGDFKEKSANDDQNGIFFEHNDKIIVFDNATIPQQLLEVHAVHEDLGNNAAITYHINATVPADSADLFSINRHNGTISLIDNLDYESRASHKLIIEATDGVNFNTTVVIISVADAKTPPEFPRVCNVSIPDDLSPGMEITQCVADAGNEHHVAERYELVSGNIGGKFSINNNGAVYLKGNVDHEDVPFYNITVRAFDRAGLFDTTQLLVTVNHVDRNRLIFQVTRIITRAEIRSQKKSFFTAQALHSDIGVTVDVSYSLVSKTINDSMTELIITASDEGSRNLSNTMLLMYQFEVPCMLQEHTINATTGEVISDLLCNVSILPQHNHLTYGLDDLRLKCTVLGNVNTEATYEFVHNGSIANPAAPLNPIQATGILSTNHTTYQEAGEYSCKVTAPALGTLQSNTTTVRIQGTHIMSFFLK